MLDVQHDLGVRITTFDHLQGFLGRLRPTDAIQCRFLLAGREVADLTLAFLLNLIFTRFLRFLHVKLDETLHRRGFILRLFLLLLISFAGSPFKFVLLDFELSQRFLRLCQYLASILSSDGLRLNHLRVLESSSEADRLRLVIQQLSSEAGPSFIHVQL